MSGKSQPPQKSIFLIAGPNGAGKTTFARDFLPREPSAPIFLNADEIAAKLCPRDPASVAVRAGRLMLEQITAHVEAGQSIAIETTLAGRTYARAIRRWRDAGYEISLYFLKLGSANLAVSRVAARVAQGGHDIPEVVIRRRFDAGMKNLYDLYGPLVDYWYLYDNTVIPRVLIDEGGRHA